MNFLIRKMVRKNSDYLCKVTISLTPELCPEAQWSEETCFPSSVSVSQVNRGVSGSSTPAFLLLKWPTVGLQVDFWNTCCFAFFNCLFAQNVPCSLGPSCNWSWIWNWQLWTMREMMWQEFPCLEKIQRKSVCVWVPWAYSQIGIHTRSFSAAASCIPYKLWDKLVRACYYIIVTRNPLSGLFNVCYYLGKNRYIYIVHKYKNYNFLQLLINTQFSENTLF